jgi:hypothetical protein
MPISVQVPWTSGEVVTVEFVSRAGDWWNNTDAVWEAYVSGDISKYRIPTTEVGHGLFTASVVITDLSALSSRIVTCLARDASSAIVASGVFYIDASGFEITAEEFAALSAAACTGNASGIGSGTEVFEYPDGSPAFTSVPDEGAGTRTVTYG